MTELTWLNKAMKRWEKNRKKQAEKLFSMTHDAMMAHFKKYPNDTTTKK